MRRNTTGKASQVRRLLNMAEIDINAAFTPEERAQFGLRGLLMAAIGPQEVQQTIVLEGLRHKVFDNERSIFLMALFSRNERLITAG